MNDIDTQIESLDDAAKKTVDYLYKVEGDCPPELYQAIATLRQLINEEFKPEKSLSSQFIFNIINPAIKTLLIQSKISGMEDEHILSPVAGGTGTICSCGKVCGTTDVAQQHIQWNLSLAKDKLLSLKKELE